MHDLCTHEVRIKIIYLHAIRKKKKTIYHRP